MYLNVHFTNCKELFLYNKLSNKQTEINMITKLICIN
jgi:hypothetical protein